MALNVRVELGNVRYRPKISFPTNAEPYLWTVLHAAQPRCLDSSGDGADRTLAATGQFGCTGMATSKACTHLQETPWSYQLIPRLSGNSPREQGQGRCHFHGLPQRA